MKWKLLFKVWVYQIILQIFMAFLESKNFNILWPHFPRFLEMKQFFISKWVQRLIQVKKWSFVQQKRQASRILNEQLFSVLFAVGGEMCRHKNTIGSLLGLPNFISVRASLSLPVEASFLSKGNIFVFLTFILRHFHWVVKPKIKWFEFSLHFWSLLQL